MDRYTWEILRISGAFFSVHGLFISILFGSILGIFYLGLFISFILIKPQENKD